MKHKLLSLLIALLAATSLWAIGRNDGSNMANAIDFDWINGAMHYESEGIRWYRLDLAPLYYGADSLRFYITNPSNTEAVNVVCKTSILLQDVGVTFMDSIIQTLAPQTTYDGWMLRRELFVTEQIIEIFFTVSTTGAVKLSWQALYPSGDSCEDPLHGGGFQEAGTKWYDIKAPDRDENEVMEYYLSISFLNIDEDYHDNDISNTISLNFKTDCNSPTFYSTTFTIDPASGESVLLYDNQLAALGWPDLLFSCTSSTSCRIEHTYYSYVPGESCFESINLNWEPVEQSADLNRWYALHTHDGDFNPIIPDTCDLRIKINNLSDETANVNADVYFECREEERISQKSYVLEPYGSDSFDIDRDFLERFVWPPILLDISSNQNISIQAELIPKAPRKIVQDTIVAYVCQGIWFVDTITGIGYDIESSMTWTDTIDFQDGLQIKDSIITFYIHPLVMPEPLSAEEMRGIGAVPLLVQGMPLQVAESNAALTEYYRNLGNSVDLIVRIDTAYWAKPVYKANGDLDSRKEAPLDLSTQYSANDYSDTLLLVVRSEECSFIMRIEYIFPIEGIHYSTIADLYNMAADSAFTLGAFDVVYVPDFQNGSNMYIKDETGSMVIYKVGYGLQAGDHVEAGLQGRINIYHGLYEVTPISTKAELTVTAGEAPAPMEATEVPSATNVNQFVVYKNVSFATDTAFVEGRRHIVYGEWNNQQITFYNQYYIGATLSANKTYNITAVNSIYGTTPQAYPFAVEEVTTDTIEPCLIASGTCGNNLTWTLTCDSVLTISGTGDMTDWQDTYYTPWYDIRFSVKQIVIEDGVTGIGKWAFGNCVNVSSVTIPNGVTRIADWAFGGGCNMETLIIPNSVLSIGEHAFYTCTGLKNLTLSDNLLSIGKYAFCYCYNLTSIELPNKLTTLDEGAFRYCSGLSSVTIPNSVTSIGIRVFGSCSGLNSIIVASNNSNYSSEDGVLFNKNKTTLLQFPGAKIGSYTIPQGVINIAQEAFMGSSLLLTSIVIPSSVASIGERAFYDCVYFASITCEAVTPPTCGDEVFYEVDKSVCTLYVPAQSITAYQTATGWRDFANILPIQTIHYSTIADLYDMAQDSAFTLGAFDVVYVASYQNGANMYIKDETGSMVIYKPNYGLQAGDHVEAGLQGTINIYHGIHEIAPISTKAELTVTAGEAPAPMEATEVPSLTNVSQFVVYKNMSFTTDTAFVSNRRHAVQGIWNGQEIAFFNQYYIGATLSANKTYNITAVNSVYGTTPQAYPLAVEEINTESNCDIIYLDQAGLQIETEPIILHLPVAPVIEGFTFLKWQVVAGDLEQGIYIQAVYTANDPTNAPAVYTNHANKAQKLIRNGQVYILTDDKIYSITGQKIK